MQSSSLNIRRKTLWTNWGPNFSLTTSTNGHSFWGDEGKPSRKSRSASYLYIVGAKQVGAVGWIIEANLGRRSCGTINWLEWLVYIVDKGPHCPRAGGIFGHKEPLTTCPVAYKRSLIGIWYYNESSHLLAKSPHQRVCIVAMLCYKRRWAFISLESVNHVKHSGTECNTEGFHRVWLTDIPSEKRRKIWKLESLTSWSHNSRALVSQALKASDWCHQPASENGRQQTPQGTGTMWCQCCESSDGCLLWDDYFLRRVIWNFGSQKRTLYFSFKQARCPPVFLMFLRLLSDNLQISQEGGACQTLEVGEPSPACFLDEARWKVRTPKRH